MVKGSTVTDAVTQMSQLLINRTEFEGEPHPVKEVSVDKLPPEERGVVLHEEEPLEAEA